MTNQRKRSIRAMREHSHIAEHGTAPTSASHVREVSPETNAYVQSLRNNHRRVAAFGTKE